MLSLSEAGLSHAISLQESLLLHIPAAMNGLIKAEHQLLLSMVRFTVVLVLLLISVRFSLIHLQTPDSKLPPYLKAGNDKNPMAPQMNPVLKNMTLYAIAARNSTSMAYEAVLDRVRTEIVTTICINLTI